ncbi:Putative inorganic phosphate cotransporter-like protein [Gryllus bimaculatus]|nr:Putative inorganic phosphate cotransporter-like protein [Gryllus bimaculatus]
MGDKRGFLKGLNDRLTCRQVLNFMVLLGFMFNYMLRVNLTIAIVAMVVPANKTAPNATSVDGATNSSAFDLDLNASFANASSDGGGGQQQTYGQWRIVFGIIAATYGLGAIVYLALGSGELQPWNAGAGASAGPDGDDDEEQHKAANGTNGHHANHDDHPPETIPLRKDASR